MLKRTKLSLAVSAAISAGLAAIAPSAGAQAPATQTLDRVEITGSNIRRLEGETVSPVEVITKEEMVRQGYTSVSEVLRDVTSNGSGLLSQSFSRAFAGGASGVSLRGLGVGSTLVLIDGVRMAAHPLSDDAQKPFVDTSSIPFEAVERVEVLLDGASAIYGSDAIAGVVNVILKKNYTGTGLALDAGMTTEGDGETLRLAATHGFGSSASQYSGFVSLEYRKSKEILLKDRLGEDWSRFDWRPLGGNDLRPGVFSPNIGAVGTTPYVRTPYLQRRGAPITDPANYSFLDTGCNFTALRSSQCAYEDTWSQIKPETENTNLIGRLNAKLGGGWEASFTGSYFLSDAENIRTQRTLPTGSFIGATAIGLGVTPSIIGAIPVFTVPTTYPGNTLGAPANVRALEPGNTGRKTEYETAATRLVAQLTGAVAGWDLNTQAGYTRVETDITYTGVLNPSALFAALNNPTTPFLLTGGNSPEVTNAVFPTVENTVKNELSFIQVVGTRDLMQLQGGPLGLALGAGYNYRKLYQPNAPGISTGQIISPSASYAAGSQSNTSVYAEINAPVLKELELSAALRWDDYNTYGGQTVPKVGFKYTPVRQVSIRGSYGEGFRAPSINESGESGALFGFNNIRDPLLCPVSNADGTPNLTSAANVPTFCNFAPTYLQTSNPDVKAEESKNWNIGLVLEPVARWLTTIDYYKIELENQIITAAGLSTYDPLSFAVRTTPQQVTFGDGTTGTSSVGPIQFSTSPYVNAQKTEVSGIDFATSYTFQPVPAHTVTAGLRWSHTLKYDITLEGTKFELAGTHGPEIISGNTGNPRNRGQLSFQWATGPFTAALTGNYVGSYDLTDPSVGLETCQQGGTANGGQRFAGTGTPVPEQYCKVDSFTYFNLSLQYQINKQLRVQLTGTNIFNEKPPVDLNTYGATGESATTNIGAPFNPSLHNPGAIGPFYSIGVTYNF